MGRGGGVVAVVVASWSLVVAVGIRGVRDAVVVVADDLGPVLSQGVDWPLHLQIQENQHQSPRRSEQGRELTWAAN